MRFTLTLSGPMAELVECIAKERGVSEQEAVRVILGAFLGSQAPPGYSSSLQATPVASRLLQATKEPLAPSFSPPPPPSLPPTPPISSSSTPSLSPPHPGVQGGSASEPEEAFLPGLAPPPKRVEAPSPRKPSAKEVELAWRTQETWAAHADKRRRFFAEVEGTAARPRSSPPPDIAREIRQAILEYDGDLLGPDQREEWRRESWARAAGLGIFLDPWCTAEHPENKMGEPGAKRYLEPWRPWHVQRGKGSPVSRFADLYFQRRALDEGERRPAAAERPPLAIVRAAGG